MIRLRMLQIWSLNEKADCFLMGASQAMIYDNSQNFKSVPLTKTMEACFAVRGGEASSFVVTE